MDILLKTRIDFLEGDISCLKPDNVDHYKPLMLKKIEKIRARITDLENGEVKMIEPPTQSTPVKCDMYKCDNDAVIVFTNKVQGFHTPRCKQHMYNQPNSEK